MNQQMLNNLGSLAGRTMLGLFFLLAGLNKISAYAGTQAYMESMGVASGLLPVVIALQVIAGLALILGICSRMGALALAGFSVAAALLFHANFADQMQSILFMKNIAIGGGLLLLAANGPGAWSLERFFNKQPEPVPAH